ncbi:MAG: hypothetical protein Kow00121_19550 [Elainellaceae cyanobacterium]
MCGPIAVAFSLSQKPDQKQEPQSTTWQRLRFHLLLNLGRILSYALVGAGIGLLGSVLLAGGQLAGVGSGLRRAVSLLTGGLLIWMGLAHVSPGLLPKLPFLNPMGQNHLHDRLSRGMVNLSLQNHWWTPALLGMVWGLIPCGFLYAAQLKAAETGNLWLGGATMLAFGLGTLPTMLGFGVSVSAISGDRRSQLFRVGGWVTLVIGLLTLFRTGDTMVDYTGHIALLLLALALVARPISRLWAAPMHYRRVLGVGAFILAVMHTVHMMEHTWGWNLRAFSFMLPQHQWGIALGAIGLVSMAPAALTSFDWAQKHLGTLWRRLHLLAVPGLIACGLHCILTGSHYLGQLQITWLNWGLTIVVAVGVLAVLLLRSRAVWLALSLEQWYVSPKAGSALRRSEQKQECCNDRQTPVLLNKSNQKH